MQQQTTTVNDDGTETESAKKTNDYFIMEDNYPSRPFQMDRLLLFVAIRIVSIGKLGLIMVFYRANRRSREQLCVCSLIERQTYMDWTVNAYSILGCEDQEHAGTLLLHI